MKLADLMDLAIEVQRLIPGLGLMKLQQIVKLILDNLIARGHGDKTINDIRAMLP